MHSEYLPYLHGYEFIHVTLIYIFPPLSQYPGSSPSHNNNLDISPPPPHSPISNLSSIFKGHNNHDVQITGGVLGWWRGLQSN